MKKEFSAGLIVYRETAQGPRFLLLYHGGRYWNFPKGHIEYKRTEKPIITTSFEGDDGVPSEDLSVRETSKEAAIRETFEETGIDPEGLEIKKGFRAVEKFNFFRNKEQIFKIVIFYLAETKQSEIKISPEHDGFGWFLYKDARYILAPYKDSQKLLKSAYDLVRPKSAENKTVPSSEVTTNLEKPKLENKDNSFNNQSRQRPHFRKHYYNNKPKNNNIHNNQTKSASYYMQREGNEPYDIV